MTAIDLFCLDSAAPSLRKREANRFRYVRGAHDECCICWRQMNATVTTTYIEMVAGGGLAYPQDGEPADPGDAGYMGCHPVGPRCARLVPSRYHVKAAADAAAGGDV